MTNKELDTYMKAVEPNFTSHIEKGTIEMNNEYYNLLEEKMARLINENQELNLELSGYRQAILNNKEMLGLKEENQELKKQVEDLFSENRNLRKKLENCMTFEDYKYTLNKKIKLETQQKEFIKYLEDYLNLFDEKDIYEEGSYDAIEEILQKYKEIIGGKSE